MPEQDKLKTLFPEKSVKLPDGSAVIVKPLSLKDLPKIIDAFAKIIQFSEEMRKEAKKLGVAPSYGALIVKASNELLEIFPYCINRPPEEIPMTHVPDILSLIVEQNITEESLGKWTALFQKVASQFGVDLKALVEQGKKLTQESDSGNSSPSASDS